jgi:hypothetical protein
MRTWYFALTYEEKSRNTRWQHAECFQFKSSFISWFSLISHSLCSAELILLSSLISQILRRNAQMRKFYYSLLFLSPCDPKTWQNRPAALRNFILVLLFLSPCDAVIWRNRLAALHNFILVLLFLSPCDEITWRNRLEPLRNQFYSRLALTLTLWRNNLTKPSSGAAQSILFSSCSFSHLVT